jgi:hypothetical protein
VNNFHAAKDFSDAGASNIFAIPEASKAGTDMRKSQDEVELRFDLVIGIVRLSGHGAR